MNTMTIAVCVKHVPVGGAFLRIDGTGLTREGVAHGIDPINEVALEWALQQREAGAAARVVAVCMGPAEAADTLRKALAIGADDALHVCDGALSGADVRLTARTLAAAARHVHADLVLFGYESVDGSSGAVPSAVAAALAVPLVSRVRTATLHDGEVTASRDLGRGPELAAVSGRAVLSFVEGAIAPRYPTLKAVMQTRRAVLPTVDAAELGVDAGTSRPHAATELVATPVAPRTAEVVAADAGPDAILSLLREARVIIDA